MSDDQVTTPPVPQPEAKPAASAAAAMAAGEQAAALLNGEYEILPGRPLPAFDKGPLKAYAARSKGNMAREAYFALLCEPHLTPRSGEAPSYSGVKNQSLIRLIANGPVYWPPAAGARFCFLYENTLGQPILQSLEQQQGLGWRPDVILKTVVGPMISLLSDLRDANIFHGDIRPSNMFNGGEKVLERIVLGECLSLPPSYAQPILYEPIERAMRDPIGKGIGTMADDLYAFGVSLAVILRRKDPMHGMTDREILHEKIEQGSYGALIGKERVSGPMLELLRGLLYDDRDQRWTLDEIITWLEGQHFSSKQSARKRKAARPLIFNGQSYERQNLLAMDLSSNPSEALQLIESEGLEQWITRSLEDTALKTRFDEAVASAREQGRGPGYSERLLSRVSVALDADGPIRFKGMNLDPDGVPCALAEAVVLKKDLQPFAEMINQQIIMYWLTAQEDLKIDTGTYVSRYDTCRGFLRQTNLGYGIERCLYFLNSDVPCMSERLRKYYVRNVEDVLYAYEAIAKLPGRPELFIDRHVAAFLSVRDRKVIDTFSSDLNATEPARRIMGNLKVLATIQKRGKVPPLPGLSSWLYDLVGPVYERFHDRDLRARLHKKMDKLKGSGDLMKIAMLFDDSEIMQNDYAGFRLAMTEHQNLRDEEVKIEADLERPDLFTRDTAREVAAIVSGLLAAIIILGFSFMYFLKKVSL